LDSTDGGILKLYKRNKHQGLELLYERYKKYVYTIAFHYTGNQEDALDLTQEVFIAIFKSLDTFKESFSLLPWVKRITINKCLNFNRDKKVAVPLEEEELDLPSSRENTESGVFYRDTRESLIRAINKLPANERLAIILRHMKNMKYEEIAKVMNLPLGTVKTYLHKARKSLKKSMTEDGVWEA
jgi:RNA polymerase sigma factor (sigma-70 family)